MDREEILREIAEIDKELFGRDLSPVPILEGSADAREYNELVERKRILEFQLDRTAFKTKVTAMEAFDTLKGLVEWREGFKYQVEIAALFELVIRNVPSQIEAKRVRISIDDYREDYFCPVCRKELYEVDNFCPHCGKRLKRRQ